jgi:hypothetical protein
MKLLSTQIVIIFAATTPFALAQVKPLAAGAIANAWMKTPTPKSDRQRSIAGALSARPIF